MSSTLTTLRAVVTDALGRTDTLAVSWADRGLNYGQLLAAKLYSPEELKTSSTLTVAASGTSVSLSTLTGMYFLTSIYNITNAGPVYLGDFNRFQYVVPTGAGNVKYAARYGSTLYTRPTPTATNTLTVYYVKYPTELTSASQTIDFDHYDSFITSFALQYAWACQEEKESSDIFTSILTTINSGEQVSDKTRQQIEQYLKFPA